MLYELFTVVVRAGGGTAWQMIAEWQGAESAPQDVTPDAQLDALTAALEEGTRVDGDLLREIGSALYRTMFTDGVDQLFRRAVDDALAQAKGVLLRLRLEPARAAHLPWEFLYSPAGEQLLAASVRFPVARFLPVSRPVEGGYTVELPLRMLVAVPSGSGLHAATSELSYLREATAELIERRVLTMEVIEGKVTLAALRAALLRFAPHVLHFIGHGDFDGERAYLKLNDEAGNSYAVDDEQIRALLENYPALKLVFLNSCRGATTSAQLSGVGLAPGLLRVGIPSVIAMQYEVEDEAAAAFARSFYTSLFCGADRGRIEVAVSHARSALVQEFTGQRDIGAPVLFMRTREGLLFDIPAPGGASPIVPLADKDRVLAVERALTENLQARQQCGESAGVDAYAKDASALAAWRRRFLVSNATWLAVLVSILAGLAWVSTTDWYTFYAESYLAGARGALPMHERLVPVIIDHATTEHFGKPWDGEDWRGQHAVLIDRLVAARAASIVFYFHFDVARPSDPLLAAAMRRATQAGVPVVVAIDEVTADGAPKLLPALAETGVITGFACVDLWSGHLQSVPVVAGAEPAYQPSLALAGVYATSRVRSVDPAKRSITLADVAGGLTRTVRFLDSTLAPAAPPPDAEPTFHNCNAVPVGTPRALLALAPLDETAFGERAVAYQALADPRIDIDPAQFRGKIAVIARQRGPSADPGEAKDDDRDWRKKLALLEAMNALLQRYEVHRATAVEQALFVIALSLAGALARLARRAEEPPARRAVLDGVALLLAFALAAGIGMAAFYLGQTIFNVLAGCVAAMASYLLAGAVRRRWLTRSPVLPTS